MHRRLLRLWEECPIEDRFRFMLELDKRYRAGKEIGNGLRNLRFALVRKIEMVKGIDTRTNEPN